MSIGTALNSTSSAPTVFVFPLQTIMTITPSTANCERCEEVNDFTHLPQKEAAAGIRSCPPESCFPHSSFILYCSAQWAVQQRLFLFSRTHSPTPSRLMTDQQKKKAYNIPPKYRLQLTFDIFLAPTIYPLLSYALHSVHLP